MDCLTTQERQIFEAQNVPMAIYSYEGNRVNTLLVSDGLCRQKSMTREKLMQRLNDSMFEMVHPDDAGRIAQLGRAFAKKECQYYDVTYRTKTEEQKDYHYIHTTGYYQKTMSGEEVAFLYYDDLSASDTKISQLTNNYFSEQKDMFYKDPVTGLPNSNYFYKFLKEKINVYLEKGCSPAIIFMDMNGMQAYNSKYGFAEGDVLLELVGEELKNAFSDALVTRGDSDHFVLLAPDEKVKDKLERASAAIRKKAKGVTLGFQAGVCLIAEEENVYEAIDHAKHAIKMIQNDLNQICAYYSAETNASYWSQRYVIESFDEALQNHWIKIFYQGIMRSENGKMHALEALARWNDPERGTLSPAEFIPALEMYHQMYRLDLYMVEEVCREIPLRREAGLQIIPVSINFSGKDFDHESIVEDVMEITDRYGVDHKYIIIEITEQALPLASERLGKQIEKFRQNGFKVWVDDFGSGYSSLNVFSRYRFDVLKMDMDLLRNWDDEGKVNKAVISAIVETAHRIGIQCLAEGLETPEQLAFLRRIGCDLAQGYFYHKPETLGAIKYRNQKSGRIAMCETEEEAGKYESVYSEKEYHRYQN